MTYRTLTEAEKQLGYTVCECRKYAFIFKSRVMEILPKNYAGEVCEACGSWVCAVEKLQPCEAKV